MTNRVFRFGPYTSEILFYRGIPFEEIDIQQLTENKEVLFVLDIVTDGLFGKTLMPKVVLPCGEGGKIWAAVEGIITEALENRLGRDTLFIGIGGGIVCDIVSFAASVYMRGCLLHLIPTTLLAMVDASLGGKTGFNFGGYKNIVGTFYPAEKIHIVPDTLKSLPEKEIEAGMAENIKHACLGDVELFTLLEERKEAILSKDVRLLSEVVEKSLQVKARIVERDLTESGIRAHLNLGHTFGHALESVEKLEGSAHGDAVAWGLGMAMKTGMHLGITDDDYGRGVLRLLQHYGFSLNRRIDADCILDAMKQDKKKRKGTVRFVLQKRLGETCIREVDERIIRKIITDQTG